MPRVEFGSPPIWIAIVGIWLASHVSAQTFDSVLPGSTTAVPTERQAIVPTNAAPIDSAWQNYLDRWNVGSIEMPIDGVVGNPVVQRGRPPRGITIAGARWTRIVTPLVIIETTLDPDLATAVCRDLHDLYWAWTQWFFPLWKYAPVVAVADRNRPLDARTLLPPTMRVILFRNAEEYQHALRRVPGIAASTGYYDSDASCSFFYIDAGDNPQVERSRRHEWTHQLFDEATRRPARAPNRIGERSGFWLVEGIAGMMESFTISPQRHAHVGGWDASRMQFARHRWAGGQRPMPLVELAAMGRRDAQASADLAGWYNDAIATTHLLWSETESRRWVINQLAVLYGIDIEFAAIEPALTVKNWQSFFHVDDALMQKYPSSRSITDLCLAGCDVSDRGLAAITNSSPLRWVDLTGCQVSDAGVIDLLTASKQLAEITLQQTAISDATLAAIADRPLVEVDLTLTATTDAAIERLPPQTMKILYATATKISDASIDRLLAMPNLEIVDVQRSNVTAAGVSRLRNKQGLIVNPLQIGP